MLRQKLKARLGQLLFRSGVYRALLGNVAVVVTFHRVSDEVSDGLTYSVSNFRHFCRFFSDHFHVVSLGDIVEKFQKGARLDRELAITFDDGYLDNFERAAPEMKNLGLPATFFLASGFIETDTVPWWDQGLAVSQPWMSWDHVRQLVEAGFEIGAHTRNHVDLGEVPTDEAEREILGGRTDLEQALGKPVPDFAYPYGRQHQITEASREIVKRLGFRCCCSCYGGLNAQGTNPFQIVRVPISDYYVSPYQFGLEAALRRV